MVVFHMVKMQMEYCTAAGTATPRPSPPLIALHRAPCPPVRHDTIVPRHHDVISSHRNFNVTMLSVLRSLLVSRYSCQHDGPPPPPSLITPPLHPFLSSTLTQGTPRRHLTKTTFPISNSRSHSPSFPLTSSLPTHHSLRTHRDDIRLQLLAFLP